MHTAALIARDGSIDWACLPYFDSPAVFLRLLDRRRGGYCALRAVDTVRSSRRYIEGTNILETTFTSTSGSLVVTDFMAVSGKQNPRERCCRIIRFLRCTAGHVAFSFECRPAFEFGSVTARARRFNSGAVRFEAKEQSLLVEGPELAIHGDDTVTATGCLTAGHTAFFAISATTGTSQSDPLDDNGVRSAFQETKDYWVEWSGRLRYEGDYSDEVLRSILALKLLAFAPTGAIVAAPTTSLPEVMGGDRNWDYRLSWIRDSQFALTALMHCGYFEEAHGFFRFIRKAVGQPVDQLQILYDIRGERAGSETELEELEGYRCSRPVRLGNAAGRQKQSDIYGELLNCIFVYCHMASSKSEKQQRASETWPLTSAIAEHVVRHWREPDQGIWESRQSAQQFVHSKAMCWTALDRALRLASLGGLASDLAAWGRERDAIWESISTHGFNSSIGAFVQSYGSSVLDAAVLRMPLLNVIPADDPRMLSTIKQIGRHLLRNGLLMRHTESWHANEGAFTSCTLWLINNYILLGRMDEARESLDHLLSFRNDLGLYSEELNPETGEQLGNFPQALTHVALISAIRHLEGSRPGSLHAS
jgi:alpha,alpha-trehalase